MDLSVIFGTGLAAHVIQGAVGLACALVMALCPAATIAYRVAALVGPLLDLAAGAGGSGPKLSTSSSALHTGSAPAVPPAPPRAPQVVQRAPEQDQEGLP